MDINIINATIPTGNPSASPRYESLLSEKEKKKNIKFNLITMQVSLNYTGV